MYLKFSILILTYVMPYRKKIRKKIRKKMKTSKKKFTTTLNVQLLEQLKIVAIKQNCSVSSIMEKLITNYLTSLSQADCKDRK